MTDHDLMIDRVLLAHHCADPREVHEVTMNPVPYAVDGHPNSEQVWQVSEYYRHAGDDRRTWHCWLSVIM